MPTRSQSWSFFLQAGVSGHVRVVRDYGMFDRREVPQYYPDVERQRSDA